MTENAQYQMSWDVSYFSTVSYIKNILCPHTARTKSDNNSFIIFWVLIICFVVIWISYLICLKKIHYFYHDN